MRWTVTGITFLALLALGARVAHVLYMDAVNSLEIHASCADRQQHLETSLNVITGERSLYCVRNPSR